MPKRTAATTTGFAGLLSLLAVVGLLWLFAPTTVGGKFAYATVTGNSMAPLLQTGDLVLLRSAPDYEVGDAVAYRHPQLGVVLHRIVGRDGDRFTLSGDNRAGDDTFQPAPGDIVGREWVIVPSGGHVVEELQRPRNLILLVGATLLLLSAGGRSRQRARRAATRWSAPASSSQRSGAALSAFAPAGRQVLALGLVAGLASVVLLVLFIVNGTTRAASEPLAFSEGGTFVYGGPVAAGVYDDDQLTAPEPLYRRLVNELPVRFSYDLTAADPEAAVDASGTYDIVAQIISGDGWTRTYPLAPPTVFTDGQFEAVVSLDLPAIDADLAAVAELTGVASSLHVLRVIARVQSSGQIDGVPLATEYEQWAQFRLTPLQLQFDGDIDTLTATEPHTVARAIVEPRVLDLPMVPWSLTYSQFPLVGGLSLGLAIVLLLLVLRATRATADEGEAARIGAAHGALLVEMANERAALGARPHDVSRFADLVRLATAEGLAIMHRASAAEDEYLVMTADRSWRYVARKPAAAAAAVQAAPEGRFITTSES